DTSRAAIGLKGDQWYGSLGNTLSQTMETWSKQTAALVARRRDIQAPAGLGVPCRKVARTRP
ncbi:hypothetical protein, partial [Streptomyces sp.]